MLVDFNFSKKSVPLYNSLYLETLTSRPLIFLKNLAVHCGAKKKSEEIFNRSNIKNERFFQMFSFSFEKFVFIAFYIEYYKKHFNPWEIFKKVMIHDKKIGLKKMFFEFFTLKLQLNSL